MPARLSALLLTACGLQAAPLWSSAAPLFPAAGKPHLLAHRSAPRCSLQCFALHLLLSTGGPQAASPAAFHAASLSPLQHLVLLPAALCAVSLS